MRQTRLEAETLETQQGLWRQGPATSNHLQDGRLSKLAAHEPHLFVASPKSRIPGAHLQVSVAARHHVRQRDSLRNKKAGIDAALKRRRLSSRTQQVQRRTEIGRASCRER